MTHTLSREIERISECVRKAEVQSSQFTALDPTIPFGFVYRIEKMRSFLFSITLVPAFWATTIYLAANFSGAEYDIAGTLVCVGIAGSAFLSHVERKLGA